MNQHVCYQLKHLPEDLVSHKTPRLNRLTHLSSLGLPSPETAVITPQAFVKFLHQHNLYNKIKVQIQNLDPHNPEIVSQVAKDIRKLVQNTAFEAKLADELEQAFNQEIKRGWFTLFLDQAHTPHDSLSYRKHPLKGGSVFLNHVRELWASVFTPKYVHALAMGHQEIMDMPPVLVQSFSEAAVSGFCYSIDPYKHDKGRMVVEAVWGNSLKSSELPFIPDLYYLSVNGFEVLSKQTVEQQQQIEMNRFGHFVTGKVEAKKRQAPKLSPLQLHTIAQFTRKIHNHLLSPVKVYWHLTPGNHLSINGYYFLEHQLEHERELRLPPKPADTSALTGNLDPISRGIPASPGLISAPARVIKEEKQFSQLKNGEIVVASFASAKLLPVIKKASGLVTETGGITSHAAIVARETGCPAIVSAKLVTNRIKTGEVITLNGETGEVFKGGLPAGVKEGVNGQSYRYKHPYNNLPTTTATKIFVNLADASKSAQIAALNTDGIGLVRGELLLLDFGKHPKKLRDEGSGEGFKAYLVETLTKLAEAAPHKPVIYRSTDLLSSQYRLLSGGKLFEPRETNPMLGYHGALRLLSDSYLFELELQALKKVRTKHRQVHLSVPYVRSPEELQVVKKLTAGAGLIRGSSFELYLSLDTPAAALSTAKMAAVGIDGVIINLNQLAASALMIDPVNPEVNRELNPEHPGLLNLIGLTAEIANRSNLKTLVSGSLLTQSDMLLYHLLETGLYGICVDPTLVNRLREQLYVLENKRLREGYAHN